MPTSALFPISVSNRLFSTANIKRALGLMPTTITDVTFLIADWLQLYNRAINCNETLGLGEVIRDYRERNNDLMNRQRWISNFLDSYPDVLDAKIKIVGMEHYFDASYANVFRNINILYSVDEHFKNDIRSAANVYLCKRKNLGKTIALSLSEQYILEEIALNIRIRVKEMIEEEYYLGKYHFPMLKVYKNCYSATPEDLLGGEISHGMSYKFFSLSDPNAESWISVDVKC